MDSVTFEKGGVCGWKKVRHLPQGSSTWYPSTDRLAGTDVFGDSSDDSAAWGVKFDTMTFNTMMFATNNFEKYTVLPSSTFTRGSWLNGAMVQNHASSVTQDGPGTSQVFYRKGIDTDPNIALTDYRTDSMYEGGTSSSFPFLLQGEFGGVGVWIRQSDSDDHA